MSRVAVVTLAHGRHEHLRLQHASLLASTRPPDDYVLVAMDDPELVDLPSHPLPRRVLHVEAEPHGLPLARARNAGVELALGDGADVVVCLDVDCLAGPELVASYADVVGRRPSVVWSGPVTYLDPPPDGGYDLEDLAGLYAPHPARPAPAPGEEVVGADPDLFWSLSFALGREAWQRSGGFCEDYVGYGAEDTDYARSARAAGLRLGWVGAARAFHQHHPTEDPPRQHLHDIARNATLFRARWGTWPMSGWLDALESEGLLERREERVLVRRGS